MTKSIIAAAIAATFASATFASDIKPLSADQFTIGGAAAVGGYFDHDRPGKDDFINGGTTAFTLKTSYRNGSIVGYMENDIIAGDEDTREFSTDVYHDLDKLWVGYEFKAGTLSYGLENDTALDRVDGAGDVSVEFGMSAPEASDQFDVFKFEGREGQYVYGISRYNFEKDGHGYNGYVGMETSLFNVYAGYEQNSDEAKYRNVASLSGNAGFGNIEVGANVWRANGQNGNPDVDGYYMSAGISLGTLAVSGGYGNDNNDEDAINFGASVATTANTRVMFDISRNLDNDSNQVFVKAEYSF